MSAADDHRASGTEQLPDGELLRRFTTHQDEAAFRGLVGRYTPLVMSVALRTTHDRQAAEDVLQATFLVLIEKAESLEDPAQVAAWLHGVAMRISRRLVDKRHRHREQPHRHENHVMATVETTDPFEQVCQTRDHDVLGEELQKLPEKFRTPMVLRYLEDLTNEQVAERLGLKASTVEGRLKRGKKELRRRLARRGVTLGAAMLVWNMTQQAVAAAPVASLTDTVATTALAWQSPTPALAPPTEPAISLAQQEITLMSTLKLTTAGAIAGAVLLTAGLLVAMTGADEGATAASAGTSPSSIDTSVSSSAGSTALAADSAAERSSSADLDLTNRFADATVAPESTAPPDGPDSASAPPIQFVEVFELNHADAELVQRMLTGLFEGIVSEDDERRPVVTADAETNRVIVRGEPHVHELSKVLLQKLDELAERDLLKLRGSAGGQDATQILPSPATTATADETEASTEILAPNVVNGLPIAAKQVPDGKPQGSIRRVDEATRTVWLNLGSDDGLQPQVRFRVNGRPPGDGSFKGSIEVVRITGPHLAEARIVNESLELPMTAGDIVYSPDWTPVRSEDAAPTSSTRPEAVDLAAEPAKEIKIFQLQHASALSAGELLKELFKADDTTPDSADGNQLRIVGEPRTNVIVASGAPDQLAEIEAIVMRLDQPTVETTQSKQPAPSPPQMTLPADRPVVDSQLVVAYSLKTVGAAEASKLVNKLLEESSSRPGVTVDAEKNMLVIQATQQQHEQVRRLLEVLDRPRPEPSPLTLPVPANPADGWWERLQSEIVDVTPSRFDITHRSPAGQKLQRALQSPTSITDKDGAIADVLRILADRHGIQMYFDLVALVETPLDIEALEVPINVTDVPLATALDLLLWPLPPGKDGDDSSRRHELNSAALAYFVQDDVLVITTRGVAEQTMQVRTYDLRPFDIAKGTLDRGGVVEAVRAMTGESTWDNQKGRGSLMQLDHALIVRASPLVHREIEALLRQLLLTAQTSAEPAEPQ